MQVNKRGQQAALGGLVLQLILTGMCAWLWHYTRSGAAWSAFWLMLAAAPMWLFVLVLFYCRFLQRREEEEISQLAARGAEGEGIFADGEIRPAANRVRWIERWLTPGFTLALIGYHFFMGATLLRALSDTGKSASSNVSGALFFVLGGAFVALLYSRYTGGMGKLPLWRLLRAPASYMFADALAFALLAITFGLEYLGVRVGRVIVEWALPILMLVLGVELTANFVLDFFRPRVPGAEQRFSYDSRLLSLIAYPEDIGHGIAEAINYQFGFEASSTWFYQLLQRAVVPLALAGALIMWLLTSIVTVDEGHQAVVLEWGQFNGKVLQPRPMPYLVWPQPINQVRFFDTGKVYELALGVGAERKDEFVNGKRVYLWSEEHGPRAEQDVLVAMPPRKDASSKDVPPVSIIKMITLVYYRITDPVKFGFKAVDPEKLLEDVAYREMVQYAASATLDEPLPESQGRRRPQGLMSFGREQANIDLKERIAKAVAALDIGAKIVDVQLEGCHPPKEAAPAFEAVIAAEREQDKARYAAQAESNKILAETAGVPEDALRLAQSIAFFQQLESLVTREGQARARQAGQYLAEAKSDADKLRQEIENDRLLGKLRPNRQTMAQELLSNLEAHMKVLEATASPAAASAGKVPTLEAAYADARKLLENLFSHIQGKAAVLISQAQAYRWQTEFRERARAESFDVELMALRAAPDLYRLDKYLKVLAEGLASRRKYVLGVDRDRVELRLNLEQPTQTLGDIPFGKTQK